MLFNAAQGSLGAIGGQHFAGFQHRKGFGPASPFP
jgi:hypothetical protein